MVEFQGHERVAMIVCKQIRPQQYGVDQTAEEGPSSQSKVESSILNIPFQFASSSAAPISYINDTGITISNVPVKN